MRYLAGMKSCSTFECCIKLLPFSYGSRFSGQYILQNLNMPRNNIAFGISAIFWGFSLEILTVRNECLCCNVGFEWVVMVVVRSQDLGWLVVVLWTIAHLCLLSKVISLTERTFVYLDFDPITRLKKIKIKTF